MNINMPVGCQASSKFFDEPSDESIVLSESRTPKVRRIRIEINCGKGAETTTAYYPGGYENHPYAYRQADMLAKQEACATLGAMCIGCPKRTK